MHPSLGALETGLAALWKGFAQVTMKWKKTRVRRGAEDDENNDNNNGDDNPSDSEEEEDDDNDDDREDFEEAKVRMTPELFRRSACGWCSGRQSREFLGLCF